MIDAFSSSCGQTQESGRVCKVTAARMLVRLRSEPVWARWHWIDGGWLCGGAHCLACQRGFPRRESAYIYVDRPQQTVSVLQCTTRDLMTMSTSATGQSESLRPGMHFRVWRSGSRQPLSCEFAGETHGLIVLPPGDLMSDVMSFYRVRVSGAEIETGRAQELIQAALADALGGRRVERSVR